MDEEPVEILVGMAERGEVDPWNIDIVDLTDRFLAELERRKRLDLRISGRTLFYAACLLRLKSEYLGRRTTMLRRRLMMRRVSRGGMAGSISMMLQGMSNPLNAWSVRSSAVWGGKTCENVFRSRCMS